MRCVFSRLSPLMALAATVAVTGLSVPPARIVAAQAAETVPPTILPPTILPPSTLTPDAPPPGVTQPLPPAVQPGDQPPAAALPSPKPERQAEGPVTQLTDKPVAVLLDDLKRERDPDAAKAISGAINAAWADSGSATVNLLLQWANDAVKKKNNAAALDFLDQAIVLDPTYAEAWNRRATLHYTMGNLRKSMADINRTLALEPRHFGALAGLALIMTRTEKPEKALEAWQRYLDVYPANRDVQTTVSDLSESLAGSRT